MKAKQGNGCLARLRARTRDGARAGRQLAAFILSAPEKAKDMTLRRLAGACATSPATVTAFCRGMGYPGFRAFQMDLATDQFQTKEARLDDFLPDEPPTRTVARVFEGNRRMLSETEKLLDFAMLLKVARVVEKADRIRVFGLGGSGLIALYAAQRLASLGFDVAAETDPYNQLLVAGGMRRGDLAIGISHGGRTAPVIEAIRTAGRRGAQTVSITNYPQSPLARACAFPLITAFREHRANVSFSTSHVAQMSICDALYFLVARSRLAAAGRISNEAESAAEKLLRVKMSKRID